MDYRHRTEQEEDNSSANKKQTNLKSSHRSRSRYVTHTCCTILIIEYNMVILPLYNAQTGQLSNAVRGTK